MRKLSYLVILKPSIEGYNIIFPDFPSCSSYGKDIIQALTKAKKVLELHIYDIEKNCNELLVRSNEIDVTQYKDSIVSQITIFPDLVKNEMDNKRVKTNTTIPRWLKEIAEANKVNFSQLLEASLIDYLGLEDYRNGRKEVKK